MTTLAGWGRGLGLPPVELVPELPHMADWLPWWSPSLTSPTSSQMGEAGQGGSPRGALPRLLGESGGTLSGLGVGTKGPDCGLPRSPPS